MSVPVAKKTHHLKEKGVGTGKKRREVARIHVPGLGGHLVVTAPASTPASVPSLAKTRMGPDSPMLSMGSESMTMDSVVGNAAELAQLATALAPLLKTIALPSTSAVSKRSTVGSMRDIPDGATSYFGSLSASDGLDTYAVIQGSISTLTTTAGGLANVVYTNDPSFISDWASLAAVFDEFRVLGMNVHYEPINRYQPVASPGSITPGYPMAVVIDRDDTTALTSYAQAGDFASSELRNSIDPWTRVVRMAGGPDDNWVTTASPAATFAVKVYAANLSATFAVALVHVRLLIQFRQSD